MSPASAGGFLTTAPTGKSLHAFFFSFFFFLLIYLFLAALGLFKKFYLFNLFLFLAVLGICCCAQAFSSCSEWGLLFVAVFGLPIAVASLVAEHGL